TDHTGSYNLHVPSHHRSRDVRPVAPTHSTTTSPSQLTPALASTSSFTAQSHDDAMLATMKQIANLLSGFQKQFPPTNNQLMSSSNTGTHATVHDRQITTESVQRRAPGNTGNTGYRGNQNNGQGVNNKKKVICYNCRGEGHVARQCKEPKRPKDSLWNQDKAMLLQAKENGAVLDAEAEAFLADVECTVLLVEPLALTTTNMFHVNHEDAYDSDVDDEPNAAAAFMANLSSSSSLGLSNPWFGRKDQLSQPTLYDGHRLLQPGHAPVTVSDSHETLLETEVSRMKMSQKPGHVTPVDYTKLNALYDQFVPQKELSREQVYWLSASDISSQSIDPPKPVTPFIYTRLVNSNVHTKVWKIKECLTPFEEVIKKRTAPPSDVLYHREYNCIKKCFDEEVIPFFNNIKQHFQLLDHNIYMEVKEFECIFDELDSEYEQTVLANKNLQIEKKNLLIKNECLISNSISKYICSIVLASVNIVPP
nr:hypothetical protein [Tanacetum cinerariifolium]